ncbi:hypothetical protein [Pelotomaculum propionicicum]|uniref:Uncharacterized protein n=1 Tax=Pelotomaculum propionicicum TaxID=258475 RepID=A0A4Y7RLE0_9FIRM|nr:hypothetical protein [Pelotomaculum propionicicum]NLI14482.1 hypothetical protein [Peptococcaceae bacterium]TEB09559.1 hypothetical protein Pmgp_03055 [Pelotomaculum propionicicum]
MKKEHMLTRVCETINKETEIIIRVCLAERWCGYDIVRLSECDGKNECGVKQCEFIYNEEEAAFDQLIAEYLEQQDIREKIRENIKYSNF